MNWCATTTRIVQKDSIAHLVAGEVGIEADVVCCQVHVARQKDRSSKPTRVLYHNQQPKREW